MQLTPEQDKVLNALVKGFKAKTPIQTLGGFAGTGKTVLVSKLVEIIPDAAICAYTGKAANVLTRKGVNATTIHRLIYEAVWDKENNRYRFIKKKDLNCPVVIVDESSMVGREIYNHLLSFKKPIIFVGDHGQLEPVGSEAFNIMQNPEYRLETIHRNAGEISRFAEWVRMGNEPNRFSCDSNGQIQFFTKPEIKGTSLPFDVDQIICAFNKTRVQVNERIREGLYPEACAKDEKVAVGEKVICLRNNYDFGVFNGMQAQVTGVKNIHNAYLLDLDSYGEKFKRIPVIPEQFGQETTPPMNRDYRIPFDYASCITAHKSQGDEYGKVMVLEQRFSKGDHRRWAYTAASRAREGVLWVTGF